MSEHSEMLAQTVDRLFRDIAGQAGGDGWARIDDLGIADMLLPEADGGMDGSWQDAALVFALCGYHAIGLPVGETIIARKIIGASGMEMPSGPLAIGDTADGALDQGFTGTVATRSPTDRVDHILLDLADRQGIRLLLNPADAVHIAGKTNVAGEARTIHHFAAAPAVVIDDVSPPLIELGAFLRSCQSAGALKACLERSVQYCGERSQFGRPLQTFQAIQHQLALLAEETAAVMSASSAAALALDRHDGSFEVACAKLRANQAVGPATSIAHQVHGAIGFTKEYGLYRHTQRLWAWRSEFGNDRYWAQALGRTMLGLGGRSAWAMITGRGEGA